VVSDLVRDTGSTIVCLQETKLHNVDVLVVSRIIGQNFANSFAVLLASQTRGGVLLATNVNFFEISSIQLSTHTIIATLTMRADATRWKITVVYGPQRDDDKLEFLQELRNINPSAHGHYLIYQAQDKNNSNLNRHLMNSFKATIDDLGLKEIKLNGRRYTWSNEQHNPTLTRIDSLLCTLEWELIFPTCFFHSLPSLMSDHMPLLLLGELEHFSNPFLHFENYWTKMDGSLQVV
jgi:exonuclease III